MCVCCYVFSFIYHIHHLYCIHTHIACLRCPMCLKAASTTWDAVVSVVFWMIGHGIVAVIQPFATEATLDCLWIVNVLWTTSAPSANLGFHQRSCGTSGMTDGIGATNIANIGIHSLRHLTAMLMQYHGCTCDWTNTHTVAACWCCAYLVSRVNSWCHRRRCAVPPPTLSIYGLLQAIASSQYALATNTKHSTHGSGSSSHSWQIPIQASYILLQQALQTVICAHSIQLFIHQFRMWWQSYSHVCVCFHIA